MDHNNCYDSPDANDYNNHNFPWAFCLTCRGGACPALALATMLCTLGNFHLQIAYNYIVKQKDVNLVGAC